MIKAPQELKDYCVVCNEVARRNDLSARAKGIYYYLATLPFGWELSQNELFSHFTEGRDALRTSFKELIDAGYVKEYPRRDDKGRLLGKNYEVMWSTEVLKKPTSEKPNSDNQKQVITYKRVNTEEERERKDAPVGTVACSLSLDQRGETDIIPSPKTTPPKPPSDDELFEECWAMFGKYGTKKKAKEYWRKLKPEDRLAIKDRIPAYLNHLTRTGYNQKMFQGWINPKERMWETTYENMATPPKGMEQPSDVDRDLSECEIAI